MTALQELYLARNGLTGTIPTNIGLMNLVTLWLNDNSLVGTIPTELANMSLLREVLLNGNQGLVGSIPFSLCDSGGSRRHQVDCARVACACCLPECSSFLPTYVPVANETTLASLQSFLGPLTPDGGAAWNDTLSPQYKALAWLSLSELSNTTFVQRYVLATLFFATSGLLWNDNIRWLSHSDHCTWPGLECDQEAVASVFLRNNSLNGTVPRELAMLSDSLVSLDLQHNEGIQGTLPSDIGMLSNMLEFRISYCSVGGVIPLELTTLGNLTQFHAYSNVLTGSIPTEIGLMSDLAGLDLGLNSLNGTLPTEIANLTQLVVFSAPSNEINGTIPTEFGLVSSLETIFLNNMILTGTVPPAICTFPNLTTFWSDCDEIGCTCCTHCCSGPMDQNCSAVV
eukprot:CAMPEP_0116577692 /NCGR_PEP_ID=MMETSP0397-20121206/21289_1 /TAXON_ID=216820 /ORGANISM="Cyclophora tenuis, Strain ECT3854" /LENGTH=397 /DNA_ID=CAMNT_0004106993 /DNA_START=12 /DNA_END=1205 /DNA_ORIENTATION=+